MSLIILHVIPSLIGYIIIVLNFNGATWSFFPKHQFRQWAELMSIFLIISFRLEQQAWFRVCVVVPITFRFIIPLTWCRRRSITSSWNLFTNVSWSSSSFQTFPGYQPNSWWEIPSLPPRWIVAEPVGPILIFSLLKLYDLFYKLFRWILCVSEVWPFSDDHVNTIPKHVCGTLIINKNIGSAMLTVLDLLSKHRCMGNIMILPLPPLSKCFWTCCHILYILLRFPLGRIYFQFLSVNTFSFPLVC